MASWPLSTITTVTKSRACRFGSDHASKRPLTSACWQLGFHTDTSPASSYEASKPRKPAMPSYGAYPTMPLDGGTKTIGKSSGGRRKTRRTTGRESSTLLVHRSQIVSRAAAFTKCPDLDGRDPKEKGAHRGALFCKPEKPVTGSSNRRTRRSTWCLSACRAGTPSRRPRPSASECGEAPTSWPAHPYRPVALPSGCRTW